MLDKWLENKHPKVLERYKNKAISVYNMYFGDFNFIEFVEFAKDIKLTQL